MVFETTYWKGRLEAAKTQEDFAQLLEDLPDNPLALTNRVGQESFCTNQR